MKIKITADEITFVDLPVYVLLLYSLFFIFGLGATAICLYKLFQTIAISVFNISFYGIMPVLIGSIFTILGGRGLLKTNYCKVSVNRSLKIVSIRESGLLRKRERKLQAKEVTHFSYSEQRGDSCMHYTIFANLINGQSVKLNSPICVSGKEIPSREECEKIVSVSNDFIKK